MIVQHAKECLCPQCTSQVRVLDDLKYNWYNTKLFKMVVENVEYTGYSWRVNFLVFSKETNKMTSRNWYPLDVWNRVAAKWREG